MPRQPNQRLPFTRVDPKHPRFKEELNANNLAYENHGHSNSWSQMRLHRDTDITIPASTWTDVPATLSYIHGNFHNDIPFGGEDGNLKDNGVFKWDPADAERAQFIGSPGGDVKLATLVTSSVAFGFATPSDTLFQIVIQIERRIAGVPVVGSGVHNKVWVPKRDHTLPTSCLLTFDLDDYAVLSLWTSVEVVVVNTKMTVASFNIRAR